MLIAKEPIKAKKSCSGQYNFQYPDDEATGIIIKTGAKINLLSWTSNGNLQAASVQTGTNVMVVWVDPRELNEKCSSSS